MFGDLTNPTIFQALVISIFSMAMVFAVLLVISYVIDLTALILRKATEKKAAPAAAAPAAAAPVEEAVEENNEELVLLVAAAVAGYMGKNLNDIQVRRIVRCSNQETLWGKASIMESVR